MLLILHVIKFLINGTSGITISCVDEVKKGK